MQRRQFVHRTLLSLPIIGLTVPDVGTEACEHKPADSAQDPSEDEPPTGSAPAWGTPTLGGMQFWGDLHFEGGWKIQRNVLTGHCRLLDPRNFRFASGSLEDCQRSLRAIASAGRIPADPHHMVILCHGIGRSSKSFRLWQVSCVSRATVLYRSNTQALESHWNPCACISTV